MAIKRAFLAGVFLAVCASFCEAQTLGFGTEGTGDSPIEIISSGGTSFDGTIATATGNVAVYTDDASLYADRADYDTVSGDVFLEGNVRIYSGSGMFTGDRAAYNINSKQTRASNFRAKFQQFQIQAGRAFTIGSRSVTAEDAIATTHDLSTPDYHLRARKVRVLADDRVVMQDVTLVIGETPVFWLPYVYQPLNESVTFGLSAGFSELWGAFALLQYGFPVAKDIDGVVHLDPRSKRGVGLGLDFLLQPGGKPENEGILSGYYLNDSDPNLNLTSIPRFPTGSDRYRIKYDQRLSISEFLYAKVRIDKLSDQYVLEDFFQNEFALNPQPESYAAITQRGTNYTGTLLGQFQVNEFDDTVERLPEFTFETARTPWFGLPVFYESQTSAGFLRQNFAENTTLIPDYSTFRVDSFHQWTYPTTFFGWLTVVPRAAVRGTYYEQTTLAAQPFSHTGSKFKPILHGGVEASFKFSKVYENIDDRRLGLDGLRHIVQPYMDFSHVTNLGFSPNSRLLYDTLQPTTQYDLITFPQFNAVDSIDDWDILRLGFRNRLQTRRDSETVNWLELDTFFNINFNNPYSNTDYSNLFNIIRFEPVPWAYLSMQTQIPLTSAGFTEINTEFNFLVTPEVQLTFGHRYLENNPFFDDSNLFRVGGYARINDNWAVSVLQQIEVKDGTLESQEYMIHRDMTSWVASVGAVVRDNRGVDEIGVMFTITLKDFPQFSLPFNLNPGPSEP